MTGKGDCPANIVIPAQTVIPEHTVIPANNRHSCESWNLAYHASTIQTKLPRKIPAHARPTSSFLRKQESCVACFDNSNTKAPQDPCSRPLVKWI
jgi:hypothetical protein